MNLFSFGAFLAKNIILFINFSSSSTMKKKICGHVRCLPPLPQLKYFLSKEEKKGQNMDLAGRILFYLGFFLQNRMLHTVLNQSMYECQKIIYIYIYVYVGLNVWGTIMPPSLRLVRVKETFFFFFFFIIKNIFFSKIL